MDAQIWEMGEKWGGIQVFIEIRGGWLKNWNQKIEIGKFKGIQNEFRMFEILGNSKIMGPKMWEWNIRDNIYNTSSEAKNIFEANL